MPAGWLAHRAAACTTLPSSMRSESVLIHVVLHVLAALRSRLTRLARRVFRNKRGSACTRFAMLLDPCVQSMKLARLG